MELLIFLQNDRGAAVAIFILPPVILVVLWLCLLSIKRTNTAKRIVVNCLADLKQLISRDDNSSETKANKSAPLAKKLKQKEMKQKVIPLDTLSTICYNLTEVLACYPKIIDEAIQSKIHAAALELIENEKTKPCHMQIAVLLSVLPLSKSGMYRPIYATALRFLDDSESYAPLVLLESVIDKDDGFTRDCGTETVTIILEKISKLSEGENEPKDPLRINLLLMNLRLLISKSKSLVKDTQKVCTIISKLNRGETRSEARKVLTLLSQ